MTLSKINNILKWRPGGYLRASGWLFIWLLIRSAVQTVNVILLARWLGVEGYGAFVSALAVASFFTPLAGLGMAVVLLRDCSRIPLLIEHYVSQALRLWVISAAVSTILAATAISLSLPNTFPFVALFALAIGETAASSLIEIIARIEQARQRIAHYGAVMAGLPIARLVALILIVLLLEITPTIWLLAYGLSSLFYCLFVAISVMRLIQLQRPLDASLCSISPPPLPVREGLPFTVGALAFRLQNEFNKPVLAQIGYAQAGAFGIAQRMIELANLPLAALQEALWPRLFACADPKRRILVSGTALMLAALIGGLAIALAAPLVPWLLGVDYRGAGQLLIWLAPLPAIQVGRNLGNAWIIAKGQSHLLTMVYITAAVSGVGLTLLWVPGYGTAGAIAAIYASEVAAIMTQWLMLHIVNTEKSREQIEARDI